MVTSAFRSKLFVTIYIAGAAALALHLSHGFQSAFQTLGINHKKYNFYIKALSYAVGISMVAFAAISIYFLLGLDIKPEAEYNNVIETIIE
jgi:succinate dehydrogenase / fumarate reductase cytochrome b subunit